MLKTRSSVTTKRNILPVVIRWTWMISALLLTVVGLMLFGGQDFISKRWPWPLTPFNQCFLGAIYFSLSMPLWGVILKPSRRTLSYLLPVFTMITGLLLGLSWIYRSEFTPRTSTQLWFSLYAADFLMGLGLVYFYRQRFTISIPTFQNKRGFYLQSVILGSIAVAWFWSPDITNYIWAWPLDGLVLKIYPAIFLSGSFAFFWANMISTSWERRLLLLTQIILGAMSVVGVLLINVTLDKIDWTQWPSLTWLVSFCFLILAGLYMLRVEQQG